MTHIKWIIHFVAAISLALLLASSSALADVSVEQQDGDWQVTAKAEPLTKILTVLGNKSGMKIAGTRKLITDPEITGTFSGSLETVLARILRGMDYATETKIGTQGQKQITRLIVLSGEIGQAPSAREIRTARKLSRPDTPAEIEQAKKDGARVTSLLETQARVVAGLNPTSGDTQPKTTNVDETSGGGSGITRNEDGTFDIDPETQARMAEATRRAQADLEALVNALRQNEEGGSGNN